MDTLGPGSWSTAAGGGSQGEDEAGQETSSSKAHGTFSVPSGRRSATHAASYATSRSAGAFPGRPAVPGGGEERPQALIPSQARAGERSAAQPSRPEAPPAPLGRGLLLSGARGGGVRSRAHRAACSQPIRRYSRVPSVPRPPRAGPVRPAPGAPAPAPPPPLTLHEFHASRCSSAPAPSPPPQAPERVLSVPFSLSLSSRPGSRARQSGLGLSARTDTSAHSRSGGLSVCPSRSPPPTGLGVARPDSAPSRGLSRAQADRPRPPPPPSFPRAHLALALSRGPRRARSRPRAPSSRFSRLLSVR